MSKLKVNEIDSKTGTTITVAAGKTLAGTDIIGETQIAADAVTAAKIATGAVGTTEIATNAVDTAEIAANAVTLTELADGTQGGTLYYGAAGAPTQLAAGTSGYFLKTQGAAANPIWASLTEYNDANVLNDIATLALQQATQNNQSAYNLANAFVDQYEDSTGIDVLTDVERNAGEYMWCAVAATEAFTSDANTMLLLHMDGANDGTTFTDSSSNTHTVTASGGAHTDTGTKKIGTASAEFITTPANKLTVTYNAMFSTTGNFTWEFWYKSTDTAAKCMWDWRDSGGAGNQDHNMYSIIHY